MKLFIATLLLSMSSVAQAYTVYDYNTLPAYDETTFAADENIPTWGKMNRLGDAASISYSFADWDYLCETDSCFSLNDFMPMGYQDVISSAFDAWASVSNLSFNQVTDKEGDIVISGRIIPNEDGFNVLAKGGIEADLFLNDSEVFSFISSGFVDFDRAESWSLDSSGVSLFGVALHEIGHTLGLNHSRDESALMYRAYNKEINSLQADDIAGIQYLYGASTVSPVSEPSTYLMFLLGLAMMAGMGRRAHNKIIYSV